MRRMMGGLTAVGLILTVYLLAVLLLTVLLPFPWVSMAVEGVLIFFCLAGKTLVKEVREVFKACDRSLDAGRRQVAGLWVETRGRCLPGGSHGSFGDLGGKS